VEGALAQEFFPSPTGLEKLEKKDQLPLASMVISFIQVKCLWLLGKALWARQIGRFQFSYG
jgi:hypothetical protein